MPYMSANTPPTKELVDPNRIYIEIILPGSLCKESTGRHPGKSTPPDPNACGLSTRESVAVVQLEPFAVKTLW